MQGLRAMRMAVGVTGVQLQAVQARSLLAAPAPAQVLQQRAGWSDAARRRNLAAAATYETATPPAAPRAQAPRANPMRVFTQFDVYKGKGAMCVKVSKPEWQETANGDIGIVRTGAMFLEFAHADTSQQQNGFGERRYDWSKKQVFALSPHEMGSLIAANQFNFIHDPFKNKPNEGTVLKSLRSAPMTDGTGIMLTIQVKDPQLQGGQFYLSLPLTDGELAVMKSVANYVIPHALGFDQVFVSDSVAREPLDTGVPPF